MTVDDEILILCPYCLSPVYEYSGFCPTCLVDITNDAKHEMTRLEYTAERRVACRYCGAEMLSLASRCPACRKWQSNTIR
jgi:predicted amidophosphoribosyltransferase